MSNSMQPHEKSHRRQGWSSSKKLETGNAAQVATMQCNLAEDSPVHVQIDIEQIPSELTACQATVVFTCDGTPGTRTFDVAAAASISGVASSVRISVQDISRQLDPAADTGLKDSGTMI